MSAARVRCRSARSATAATSRGSGCAASSGVSARCRGGVRAAGPARTTLLASVAVFGLLLFSASASADRSGRGCSVGGLRVVVARSPRIVVTRITFDRPDAPGQRFWCADWLASGRTMVLDSGEGPATLAACVGLDPCAFAAQVHVAGDYVAFIYREPDPQYNMGIDSVSEVNVRAGTIVVNANNDPSLYTDEAWNGTGQAFDGIIKLVVNTHGDVAWIVTSLPDSASDGSSAVYEHRPGQSTVVLDTASLGAISRLAITATTVT